MRERAERLFAHVFFRPAHPFCLRALRTLVCLQALWMLASRPDLPELARWPEAFWGFAPPGLRLRFAILFPPAVEWILFALLVAALLLALAGWRPALSCLVAGTLLYHFAPFEEAIAGIPHTAFGGLTLPVVALFLLAFAGEPRGSEPSAEYRWPFALAQVVFATAYLFPTLAKLRFSGPDWFSGDNIHYYAIGNAPFTSAPLALWVAARPWACRAIAAGTFLLESSAPLVAVWPAFAQAFLLAALAFHLGILLVIGYWYPSLPLLLVLVDWDRVGRALDARR